MHQVSYCSLDKRVCRQFGFFLCQIVIEKKIGVVGVAHCDASFSAGVEIARYDWSGQLFEMLVNFHKVTLAEVSNFLSLSCSIIPFLFPPVLEEVLVNTSFCVGECAR